MVTSCFALCCTERWYKGTPLTFHRMPRNWERAKKWLKALRREDTDPSRWKNITVCGKHFAPNCFTIDHRGKNLISSAVPTLHLGLDEDESSFKDKRGRKKTRRYHFADYSEEHIKKSPRDALRAFRLAKMIIQTKNERIRELSISEMCLQRRLFRCKLRIDRIPNNMIAKLGLTMIKQNLEKLFALKKKKKKTEKNTKPPKKGTDDSESDEESDSDSSETDWDGYEESGWGDVPDSESAEPSDSDEKPSLPNSESDSSDLMDQDKWAQTFREDSDAPEEALGVPVQGGLKVEKTSPPMPVIKSVSSVSEMTHPTTPFLQNGPVPVMLSNGTSPSLKRSRLTAPSSALPVVGTVSYGGPIIGISKSTQTAIIDLIDFEEDSSAVADSESGSTAVADSESGSTAVADSEGGSTVVANSSTAIIDLDNGLTDSTAIQKGTVVEGQRETAASKRTANQNYDSFGLFVTKRLNALGPKTARYLQTEFGTLLYKVEKGEVTIR